MPCRGDLGVASGRVKSLANQPQYYLFRRQA